MPSSDADKAFFQKQQNFAYSIFEHCLKTAKSMKFVHVYKTDHDVQALYCKLLDAYQHGLLDAYQHGIQAELSQDKIQDEIQNLCLTSSWTLTLEYFLVTFGPWVDQHSNQWHWQAKMAYFFIFGHEQLYSAATMSMMCSIPLATPQSSMIVSTAQGQQSHKGLQQYKRGL